MTGRGIVLAAFAACLPLAAGAEGTQTRIGPWEIDVQESAFDETKTAVAANVENGTFFAIRCLGGRVTAAWGYLPVFNDGVPFAAGEDVEIKVRVDDKPIMAPMTQVVSGIAVELDFIFAMEPLLESMEDGKKIAVRAIRGASFTDVTYSLRGAKKVVPIIRDACKTGSRPEPD